MKEALRRKFSAQPRKYYQVELFVEKGFLRKRCPSCGRYFWTLDVNRKICQDQTCQPYEFLGAPPTKVRYDYIGCWRAIESFFVRNNHTSVKRYPVVCRWRPDLFFTVASVIDFQRIEGGKIVFELPANPLVVPQMCLRFNDLANVGVTGKHYTSFCMIGQHSIEDSRGYWKDRCIELDYRLLTGPFGIEPREISFIEDVWLGYGAFGYSLEYFVRGLELGNAVFTAFEGTPDNYREMKERVVDMGAGLERFVWITQGTPTSYDSVFGPVVGTMFEKCGIDYDEEFFQAYSKLAGRLNLDEVSDALLAKSTIAKQLGVDVNELTKRTERVEAVYAVADHLRSLLFAIADGGLPSNVAGGYNLRVILRRALAFIDRFGWNLTLAEIANWHIDYLRKMYPELDEHRDEVASILSVEERRYRSSMERAERIVENLASSRKGLSEDDLIRLYDSEGITPEYLQERGILKQAPPDFYVKVTDRHLSQRQEEDGSKFNVENLPPTRLLFYEDQNLFEFRAKVQRVFDGRFIVLDKTSFYARSGGQEPDHGSIDEFEVIDVGKVGRVVLHELKNSNLRQGQNVTCRVDSHRREILMRQHTATHVLNGAARKLLGSWVWQHSAFKDVDRSRLDVTHYAHLSEEELLQLERMSNEVVRMNLPVSVRFVPRGQAEKKYGFRIYQGGTVPGRDVRIVNIRGWDVEACGGTHCNSTGQIGFIKILKAERIQDGIERIEFTAGEPAVKFVQQQDSAIASVSQTLGAQEDKIVDAVNNLKTQVEALTKRHKQVLKKLSAFTTKDVSERALSLDGLRLYSAAEEGMDEEFHITVGDLAVRDDPKLIYVGFVQEETRVRVFVFAGTDAQKTGISANSVAKQVSIILGGSGGGDPRFGQGGGNEVTRYQDAIRRLPEIVSSMLKPK